MSQDNGKARILAVGEEPPPLDAGTAKPDRGKAKKPKGTARKRTAGRFREINDFVDVTLRTLTPSEAAVWLILWRDTKPNGLAQVSQISMAERAGISDRAVRTALAGLQTRGLLTVVYRGGIQRGSSRYRVNPLPV